MENNINVMENSIDYLGLPTRASNALKRAKIRYIKDLCNKSYSDVQSIRCIGKILFEKIVYAMYLNNLHFKE